VQLSAYYYHQSPVDGMSALEPSASIPCALRPPTLVSRIVAHGNSDCPDRSAGCVPVNDSQAFAAVSDLKRSSDDKAVPLELLAILFGQAKRDLAPTTGQEFSLRVELREQQFYPAIDRRETRLPDAFRS
jgi:hypothetical protein